MFIVFAIGSCKKQDKNESNDSLLKECYLTNKDFASILTNKYSINTKSYNELQISDSSKIIDYVDKQNFVEKDSAKIYSLIFNVTDTFLVSQIGWILDKSEIILNQKHPNKEVKIRFVFKYSEDTTTWLKICRPPE